jgi:Excalibur calcium-binding domain
MFMMSLLIAISPVETRAVPMLEFAAIESGLTKKKKRKSSSGAAKFRSCVEARKAGYTHMRRGQAGYSKGLDRDGDGVACDKVG